MLSRRQLRSMRLRWPVVGSWWQRHSTTPVCHSENRCERLVEGFIRERDRAEGAELVLADMGVLLREEQAMVSEFQDTALGVQARVDEFCRAICGEHQTCHRLGVLRCEETRERFGGETPKP